MISQASHFNHCFDHAKRHHAGARRGISCEDQSVKFLRLNRHVKAHYCRPYIPRLTNLHCDVALFNYSGEVLVRHCDGASVNMKRNGWLHMQKMISGNRRGVWN